jgi:hypothetical protein
MRKVFTLAFNKLLMLFDGKTLLLPAAFIMLALCFITVSNAVTARFSDTVHVSVVDECGDENSAALISDIEGTEGFSVSVVGSEKEAEDAILKGRSEAILVILPEYGGQLCNKDASGIIRIITAPGSVSADLIRETVSGKLIARRSMINAVKQLEADGVPTDGFYGYIEEFDAPTLYRVTTVNGSSAERAVFGQGFPGYEGFAALALMLLMLTLTKQLASKESRLVNNRMLVLDHGRALAFATDIIAVFGLALLLSLLAFILAPEKSAALIIGLAAYSVLLTGLSILLSRLGGSGRIDVASPFIALVTSILGGCFVELGGFSKAFSIISKFTPQGQLISSVRGAWIFIPVLIAEGLIMAAVGFAIRKKR